MVNSLSFPKKVAKSDGGALSIGLKFVNKTYELKVDRLKCVGCGVCSIVCPKSAILLGPLASNLDSDSSHDKLDIARMDTDTFRMELLNNEKCVYCGTCTYFCPFDAIHLYESDKLVPPSELVVVKNKALPELEPKKVFCSRLNREANVYWEGKLNVLHKVKDNLTEFKMEYLHTCPGDCRKCEKICPVEAISFKPLAEALESKKMIDLDEEKCIKCGACVRVCPSDNYSLERLKINFKGEYNKIFWDPIHERLLKDKILEE